MWSYAVGMYLADLSPDDLRLVAGYGFSMGAASVLMGAIIGEAVDRFPRLPGISLKPYCHIAIFWHCRICSGTIVVNTSCKPFVIL